jgi:glutaredoxin
VSRGIVLTLIGKPGCHLCDDAEVAVQSVLDDFSGAVSLQKVNILDDSELFEKYSEQIPVLLINGQIHNYWRIDTERLREALAKA